MPNIGLSQNFLILFYYLLIIHLWDLHEDIQGGVEVSSLSYFNYSRWSPWTQKNSIIIMPKLWWSRHYKGKHSVNMSCNNVCLTNVIKMNPFYISIVENAIMETILESEMVAVLLKVQL